MYIGTKKVADTAEKVGFLSMQGRSFAGTGLPRKTGAANRFYIGGFMPDATGMHGFVGYMLDVRLYSIEFASVEQFYQLSVNRLEDLLSKNLLDAKNLRTQVQFPTSSNAIQNRVDGEAYMYHYLAESGKGNLPSFPYAEHPDAKVIKDKMTPSSGFSAAMERVSYS